MFENYSSIIFSGKHCHKMSQCLESLIVYLIFLSTIFMYIIVPKTIRIGDRRVVLATRVNETTRSVHRLTRANVSIAAGMAQGIHSHIEATKNKEWSSAANVEFLQEFSSWPEHKRNERIKHLEMSPDAFEEHYSKNCKFLLE